MTSKCFERFGEHMEVGGSALRPACIVTISVQAREAMIYEPANRKRPPKKAFKKQKNGT